MVPCQKDKDKRRPGTFEEAGNLAAFYSKGRTAPKVEITEKKDGWSQTGICRQTTFGPEAGIQQLS